MRNMFLDSCKRVIKDVLKSQKYYETAELREQ